MKKENTMIRFEMHEGTLFRMLDKPEPLTVDAELPEETTKFDGADD